MSQKKQKQISPAARKMASEAKVDLSTDRRVRKKWFNFKRRLNEFDGI